MAEPVPKGLSVEIEKPKFSQYVFHRLPYGAILILSRFLASSVITVTVAKSRAFYLHFDLLISELDSFSNSLTGRLKEAEEKAIELVDEDPEVLGFFVEYLYRD